jgi:predicted metal-dependent hydrolase
MKLEGIDIKIEKTDRRKTVSIFIERDGSVRVLAPASSDDDKIEEAIRSKQYQIFAKLAKWRELNQGKVNRQFVNGQSFLYFGRNYRLSIVDGQDVPLKLCKGYLYP